MVASRGSGQLVTVQRLRVGDHQLIRDARLAALRDSPAAFLADLAEEDRLSLEHWARSLESSMWVVARLANDVVGLARSVEAPEDPRARYIESVWVHSAHRQHGVASRMVGELGRLARAAGATRLILWVLETNSEARTAYTRLGFVDGRTQEVSGGVVERQMSKPLR